MAVDKEDLERETGDGLKALFIIHYWGFPQDISWILDYCKDRNIILIEDCAHALYSKFQDRLLGTAGGVSIYSLPKTLAVPNGGILLINRNAKIGRLLRLQPGLLWRG
jgi:dTDP-4-amino-4,6-dideoxygalactose transaminase